jgi:mono/diheme cytochrome c family protein
MFPHLDLQNLSFRQAATARAHDGKGARTFASITASLLAVTMSFAASAEDDAGTVAKGQSLVEANCSRCHAIGKDDASHHPEAPPFRVVVTATRRITSPRRWPKASYPAIPTCRSSYSSQLRSEP